MIERRLCDACERTTDHYKVGSEWLACGVLWQDWRCGNDKCAVRRSRYILNQPTEALNAKV